MKQKVRWFCPRCRITVITYLPLSATPSHPCAKKAMKTIPLEKQEEGHE